MSKGYYKTRESVDEYLKMAEGYDGRRIIKKLKNYLTRHAKVLEIGSGPGVDWRILSKWYQVTGSDNSSEFLKHLRAQNPDGDFLHLEAASLTTSVKFEGIYSNKVLHHLTDEELSCSLERQHELLHPKGVVCHTFWKGEGSEIFKGLFVNYHTERELKKFFGTWFEILTSGLYQEFDKDDSIYIIGRRKA